MPHNTIHIPIVMLMALVVMTSLLTCSMATRGNGYSPADTQDSSVTLRLLDDTKKVYPLTYTNGHFTITDIKLPYLVIRNDGHQAVQVTKIAVHALGDDQSRLETVYFQGNTLVESQKKLNTHLKARLAPPIKQLGKEALEVTLGEFSLQAERISGEATIAPAYVSVLPLSALGYLHYVGCTTVTRIRIEVTVKSNTGTQHVPIELPLHTTTAAKYRFPLTGQVTIVNMPLDYNAHRVAHSQEFAIDLLSTQQREGRLYTAKTEKPKTFDDYYVFDRPVMAIADGAVVEVGTRFPESMSIKPGTYSPDVMGQMAKNLVAKIGLKNTLAGNYVVIDHQNGAFSFYAHLREGSIRLGPRDHVKQGEIIGRVGCTGNSTEPHLHFQLMDSPRFLEANGIPVTFVNAAATRKDSDFRAANSFSAGEAVYTVIEDN